MKAFKSIFTATVLCTHFACQALNIVTIKTESLVKESKWGIRIQNNIMQEHKKLTAPFEKLEAEIKNKENVLIEKQKALAKEEADFKNQASILSPDARADKYDDLQKQHRDLDEDAAAFQRAMKKAYEDAKKVDQKIEMVNRKEMAAFEQEVKSVIEQVAQAQNWDLVLPKEMAIYASSATDKSQVIINKLDEIEAQREKAEKAKNAISKPAVK